MTNPAEDEWILSDRELTPDTKSAVGGNYPETIWLMVSDKVIEALELYSEKSEQLAKKSGLYQPEHISPFQNLTDLLEVVVGIDSVKAVNHFHYINPCFDLRDLDALQSSDCLVVLQCVLDIFTKSDRWAAMH